MGLKIKLNSVMVENQDQALKFYTEVLGFAQGKDIPVGAGYRWITVYAPEGHHDVELALSPIRTPRARRSRPRCSSRTFPRPPSKWMTSKRSIAA